MDINVIVAVVEGIISLAVGALTFFLRRTITELDKCREDIAKVKEDYITKEDFFPGAGGYPPEAGSDHGHPAGDPGR